MLPTVTLAKNILGAATLILGNTPHHLLINDLESEEAKEDFRAALLGLMANEDYDDFEDLDSDVFVYDTLNIGDKSYKYIDGPAAEEILQIKKKQPELDITLTVHPSRVGHANTILRALVDPHTLNAVHTTELTNELISKNIIL